MLSMMSVKDPNVLNLLIDLVCAYLRMYCKYVYVCMYICVCACVCLCMYVCIHVCMYVCVCTHVQYVYQHCMFRLGSMFNVCPPSISLRYSIALRIVVVDMVVMPRQNILPVP